MATKQAFKISKQLQQIIIAVIIIAIIIILIRKQRTSSEQAQIEGSTTPDGVPVPTTTKSIPTWQKKYNALQSVGEDGLLKKGMKAKEIWQVQYLYNENIAKKEGKSKIDVDGIFGTQTEGAIRYVTEKKYNQTKLVYWRSFVKMKKSERVAHFTTASATYNPIATTNPFPADNTLVFNPYTF